MDNNHSLSGAYRLLAGFVTEENKLPTRAYPEPDSADENEARAALATHLRSEKPVDRGIRQLLADQIGGDSERKITFGYRHKPTNYTLRDIVIAMYVASEIEKIGRKKRGTVKQAMGRAMDRYGIDSISHVYEIRRRVRDVMPRHGETIHDFSRRLYPGFTEEQIDSCTHAWASEELLFDLFSKRT